MHPLRSVRVRFEYAIPGSVFEFCPYSNCWLFFRVPEMAARAARGRVAPRRGGAKRRAAALGAAQRPKAPPQAAERRAAHEACFPAFYFAPIIDKEKELTEKGVGNCPILRLRQSLGNKLHGQRLEYLRYLRKSPRKSR